jgi:septal ring factor EnvC (AmiA/AmiB activator)
VCWQHFIYLLHDITYELYTKKLEQDINELEMALDASNRGKQELEKSVKRYSTQMQDLQRKIDLSSHLQSSSSELEQS